MDKVIKDGKVAVLYSEGYGAGWYSWNTGHPECLFDPELVRLILSKDYSKDNVVELAETKYGESFYTGGAEGLTVGWVPQGEQFDIDEYDGAESLIIIGETDYLIA